MWGSYVWAVAVACILLFVPGFLLFRALRFSRFPAIIAAPIASVFAYSALPIIYFELNIESNAFSVLAPVILIAVLAWTTNELLAKTANNLRMIKLPTYYSITLLRKSISFERATLFAYLFVGFLVCMYVFVFSLGSPDAFISKWDNQTHLDMSRAFIDYGNWSSLHASSYAAYAENEMAIITSVNDVSFYPSAWHCCIALLCQCANIEIPIAFNALTFVATAFIGPLGFFLLHKVLFPDSKIEVATGALTSMCFAVLPWGLLIKGGPFYPNLFGFELMISALAIMLLFVRNGSYKNTPVRLAVFFIIALLCLTFTHPNTIFTAFVFFSAFLGHEIWETLRRPLNGRSRMSSSCAAIIMAFYLLTLLGVWVALLHAAPLNEVVNYPYYVSVSYLRGLINTLSLGVMLVNHQLILAAVVAFGALVCLKQKRYWIILPALFMAVAFFSARTGIRPLQWFMAGFWYQTAYRVAPSYIFFLIPLATIGLSSAMRTILLSLERHNKTGKRLQWAVPCICLSIFAALIFLPSFSLPGKNGFEFKNAFTQMHNKYTSLLNTEYDHVYSANEVKFVDKVVAAISENSLVFNHSQDGSTFAYGINNLKVYWQRCNMSDLTNDSDLIWKNLVNYAKDDKTKQVIKKTGAQYLLLLDCGVAYEDGVWMSQYKHPEYWEGISSITDDTPGFEIVLAEDDMRLYRLNALD